MVCPIEQPLPAQLELFGSGGPQTEALEAPSYSDFLACCARMPGACCRVGPTNAGAPPVMCDGNVQGRIALVGEAPGRKERELGVPFVGPAGNLLRNLLLHAQIPERAVYMVNMLKCRPFDEITDKTDPTRITLKDRKPSEEETSACFPLLLKQLSFAAAQYFVFLGSTAAVACLGLKPTFKITDYTGYGVPLTLDGGRRALGLVAPHPSYFLHNKGDELRYGKTQDVLKNINAALLSRGKVPMTFKLLPEELFLVRKKPSYFERREVAAAAQ